MSVQTKDRNTAEAVLVGIYGDADEFLADLRASGVAIPETKTTEPLQSNRPIYELPTLRREH